MKGYLGRSWGCFAVNPAYANTLIKLVKGGTVLFAYADPEKYDARVNHALTYEGVQLYNRITHASEGNFFSRLFGF